MLLIFIAIGFVYIFVQFAAPSVDHATIRKAVVIDDLQYTVANAVGKFFSAFGVRCMGCGGSRSLMALLELNLIKSFLLYPPILISCAFILDIDIRAIKAVYLDTSAPLKSFKASFTVIIPISIILTFIVRLIATLFFKTDLVSLAASL